MPHQLELPPETATDIIRNHIRDVSDATYRYGNAGLAILLGDKALSGIAREIGEMASQGNLASLRGKCDKYRKLAVQKMERFSS